MSPAQIISPDLLTLFMARKKLPGVVSFLLYLRKKTNLEEFYSFCASCDLKLNSETLITKGVLFHGSPRKQTMLVPRASIGRDGVVEQEALVYATNDPNYAIFLALLNLNKFGGASVCASPKNTKLSVNLGFVNGPSKLKDGYVHVVSRKFFKKTTNREYQTDRTVNVLFSVSVTPQDLAVPIRIQTKP